jgi:hypothetical protein
MGYFQGPGTLFVGLFEQYIDAELRRETEGEALSQEMEIVADEMNSPMSASRKRARGNRPLLRGLKDKFVIERRGSGFIWPFLVPLLIGTIALTFGFVGCFSAAQSSRRVSARLIWLSLE